jgi:pimeloyl-ACP methyl ester carboxylesterase
MKTNICFTSLCLMMCLCFSSIAQNNNLKSSGYAPVNGQKIYYEIYGDGKPLVLLHGSFMTIGMNWGQLIPQLSKTYKVIALEMQGHGHTALGNRPLSLENFADDIAKTMSYLKIDSTDIVGYSFGGTLAYQLAIKNPKLVKRMIIISSTYKFMGWQKECRDAIQSMKPEFLNNTPLRTEYVKVAPDSTEWTRFLEKMIAFDKQDYNLGDQNISNIKSPVLLISGDNDGVDKPILMDTYKRLGGCVFADMLGIPKSQLAIVPGQGHVSLMMQTDELLKLISHFLK